CRLWFVRGVDDVEPETGGAQQLERAVEILRDQLQHFRRTGDRRQPFLAGAFLAAGLAAGLAAALVCGAFAPGASFNGLAGLGLPEVFSTGPFAGSSRPSLSSLAAAFPLALG